MHNRYEIVERIAQGDFATVYRGRDRELGRDVAIKEIHAQYQSDPKQLDRYWQEARLLATLQHPCILTIYDIVRERGWLVLELMQGSIQEKLQGRPIDVEDLRLTLSYALQGLHVLHKNGIIHGDVKPGNLLLDKMGAVKLGDFGIARRIAGDDGSVVKGAAKYMAPEVVSDQFGPVGPHSDLYSLGFSAYELLCGAQFDELFPGLHLYGRDARIAWMMWHAAPDRTLPPPSKVLAGVPEPLARTIERLIDKDPQRRYRSAEKALLELHATGQPGEKLLTGDEQLEIAQAAAKAKRKRRLTIAGCLLSMALSLGLLFIPFGSKPAPAPPRAAPKQGVIAHLEPEENQLFLSAGEGGEPLRISIDPNIDRILLNDRRATLADLQAGDAIDVKRLRAESGQMVTEIIATRLLPMKTVGEVATVDREKRLVAIETTVDDETKSIDIAVPEAASITFNGRSAEFGDIEPGDQVIVEHLMTEGVHTASKLTVVRTVHAEGFIASIDAARRRLSFRAGRDESSPAQTRPLAADCEITLNGERAVDGRVLTIANLNANDRVVVTHDTHISRIEAQREIALSGAVIAIDREKRVVSVGEPNAVQITVGPSCTIEAAGQGAVEVDYIRAGDKVRIMHDSPDLSKGAEARAIFIEPAPDPRAWALVIGQQQYDDPRLASPEFAADSARAIASALAKEYRVPTAQLVVQIDATRRQLEHDVIRLLSQVAADSQVFVYYVGQAVVGADKAPYLAPKECDPEQPAETAIGLRWLIEQLEGCPARERILLLDTCHGRTESSVSSAELAVLAAERPGRPVSKSVVVIASCDKGQQGITLPDAQRTAFASCLAAAYAGRADANRDYRVDAAELFGYLKTSLSAVAGLTGASQMPVQFLPDATPPRLSAEARQAVDHLLTWLEASRIDDSLAGEYAAAANLAKSQPEADLAYALVLLKHNRTVASQPIFERVRSRHPQAVAAWQALAWQAFLQAKYQTGIACLEQAVALTPADAPEYTRYDAHLLEWAGMLRQFAINGAESPLALADVQKLDRAAIGRGTAAKDLFAAGINRARATQAKLDEQLAKAKSEDDRIQLARDRHRLTFYTRFDFTLAADRVRADLEK